MICYPTPLSGHHPILQNYNVILGFPRKQWSISNVKWRSIISNIQSLVSNNNRYETYAFRLSKDFLFYVCKTYQELEVLTDPMRKEVAAVRKKIDVANREVKSLGQSCQKKVRNILMAYYNEIKKHWYGVITWKQEKEYKETLEAFHQKNNEKNQLTATLMEVNVNPIANFLYHSLFQHLFKVASWGVGYQVKTGQVETSYFWNGLTYKHFFDHFLKPFIN